MNSGVVSVLWTRKDVIDQQWGAPSVRGTLCWGNPGSIFALSSIFYRTNPPKMTYESAVCLLVGSVSISVALAVVPFLSGAGQLGGGGQKAREICHLLFSARLPAYILYLMHLFCMGVSSVSHL